MREIRNLRYAGLPTIKFRYLIRFEPEAVKAWMRDFVAVIDAVIEKAI